MMAIPSQEQHEAEHHHSPQPPNPTSLTSHPLCPLCLAIVASDMEELLAVARGGDLERLKDIMTVLSEEKGAVATWRDGKRRTLLHFAAGEGSSEVCSYLVNDIGFSFDAMDHEGETPIVKAAKEGHLETVEYLLNHGANLCVLSSIATEVMFEAAKIGNLGLMKLLLDKGINIDSQSYMGTPLACAASFGQKEAVQFLIEHNAKVESDLGSSKTSPLFSSIVAGSYPCFEILIQAGADAKLVPYPLHAAALSGNVEIVKFLLEAGLDPDSCDHDGIKPIQAAAKMNNHEVVELLFPYTTPVSGVLNWTIAGVLEQTFVQAVEKEVDLADVSKRKTIMERNQSVKMKVSLLSDEEVDQELCKMVPHTERQFFTGWTSTKKRLFYESTLNSVIFDTTKESKTHRSYLRAISVYRNWHFGGSDAVYEVGPEGKKVCVSRKDQTFVFWFRHGFLDVGLVIDGQTLWVEGFLRRTRHEDGTFSYLPPIQFAEPVDPKHRGSNVKTGNTYIAAADLLLADIGGSYSGKVSNLKLDRHKLTSAIVSIGAYTEGSFKLCCHGASDLLILYSTEAGKNYWIFQYTFKSLWKRLKPISVPAWFDGTVTNHRQVFHSVLKTLEKKVRKQGKVDEADDNDDGDDEDDDEDDDEVDNLCDTVTGVVLRKLCQCLDAYVIFRRDGIKLDTRFFLPSMELEFISQEIAELEREFDETDEHFEQRVLAETVKRGTLFTMKDHGGISADKCRFWPQPLVPCTKKKPSKMQWYYLDD